MSKRRSGPGKPQKSRSHKTKKRLEIKQQTLDAKAKKFQKFK